jgi:hypothetical protein
MRGSVFQGQVGGTAVAVGYDVLGTGAGAPVLLLPALSTASTRGEMRPLAEALGEGFRVAAGDRMRLGVSHALIEHFVGQAPNRRPIR